jgi:uncharacterized protein (DUF305 family)
MSGMSGMGSSASSTSAAAPGDVMFAQMMIPHHQQAVEMADMALQDKAQASPQVRDLADQISKAQGPEIETMTSWLTNWGASTSAPMDHSMPGMMGEGDMTKLAGLSGPEFDKEWLTMMVAHHEGAITMAQDVLGTTSNAEVRSLAQSIVDGQQAEITTMKQLLA